MRECVHAAEYDASVCRSEQIEAKAQRVTQTDGPVESKDHGSRSEWRHVGGGVERGEWMGRISAQQ